MAIWEQTNGNTLNQGDLLQAVAFAIVRPEFPETDATGVTQIDVVDQNNVIVISQSCDLEQRKVSSVVVAPVFSIEEFEALNAQYQKKGRWGEVARGRVESLHLLFGTQSNQARDCMVVDFTQVAILPMPYIEGVAARSANRWRLQSPYVESMSQAFGRYFMRVALPQDLPRMGFEK
jgi:hypothetical protein